MKTKTEPQPTLATDQLELVEASYARVHPRIDFFAIRFYELLFAAYPSVAMLFPPDTATQAKKLGQALTLTVQNLRKPKVLLPVLQDLGRKHSRYGVMPGHFDAVGATLLY